MGSVVTGEDCESGGRPSGLSLRVEDAAGSRWEAGAGEDGVFCLGAAKPAP